MSVSDHLLARILKQLEAIAERVDRLAAIAEGAGKPAATSPGLVGARKPAPVAEADNLFEPRVALDLSADGPKLRPELRAHIDRLGSEFLDRDDAARDDYLRFLDLNDERAVPRIVGAVKTIRYAYDTCLVARRSSDVPDALRDRYLALFEEHAPYEWKSVSGLVSRFTRPNPDGDGHRNAMNASRVSQTARVCAAIIADADKRGMLNVPATRRQTTGDEPIGETVSA